MTQIKHMPNTAKGEYYTMSKIVKAGIMPGRINEYGVEVGTSIRQLLEIADLNPQGYEVKVDGVVVTDFDNTKVTESTNLVLLAKQIKGNAPKVVKAGIMPGRINEYGVDTGTSIKALLDLAELNPAGYEVKVDGVVVTDLNGTTVTDSTNLVLLAKQIKGN
jgi:sulfur carrier protein ThiS